MTTKTYEEKTAELRKYYGISREQYEKIAQEIDAEIMPDAKISGLGIENGNYELNLFGKQNWDFCITMQLAQKRLIGIQGEKTETKTETSACIPDYPNGRKLACGCTVYQQSEVMNASMGTSCQNCYDRMSD